MQRILFVFSLVLCSSIATATECRLSHNDCIIISRELVMESIQERRDDDMLSGMQSFPKGQKLIDLKYARIRERVKHLPRHIAEELARIYKCESEMRLIAAKGEGEPSPECR